MRSSTLFRCALLSASAFVLALFVAIPSRAAFQQMPAGQGRGGGGIYPQTEPDDNAGFIPIFDGKERFDLLFSRKGEMRVTEQAPSGQPGVAHVCRVRYLLIAGHKIDGDTKFMAANDAIEVALRPVPSANVFVPYQISIPTMAGSATIVSKRVEIVSPGKPQIALLH